MSKYTVTTTVEIERFCDRIAEAIIEFGRVTEDEAVALINAYWKRKSLDDDPLLFSEPPYFYAMCMLHHPTLGDNTPDWAQDRSLWPPPEGWDRF